VTEQGLVYTCFGKGFWKFISCVF